MKTSQLAVFSLEDGGSIRVTADGRPSIYDII